MKCPTATMIIVGPRPTVQAISTERKASQEAIGCLLAGIESLNLSRCCRLMPPGPHNRSSTSLTTRMKSLLQIWRLLTGNVPWASPGGVM
uniref:Uncharacterized protein n=1 Tax=Rhizophora mucronata TaxID=61149 RepID=A0A2P2P7Y4_RHIMU